MPNYAVISFSRSWFKYIFNVQFPALSRYCCWPCSEVGLNSPVKHRRPSKLSNKDGVLETSLDLNYYNLYYHMTGVTHRKNMEALKNAYLANSGESIHEILKNLFSINDATEFHLHLVYVERRLKLAHENHPLLMDFFLLYHPTLKIAEHCKTRDSAMRTGLTIG